MKTVPPACSWEHDNVVCNEVGSHRCVPRGNHVVAFFATCLTHTKGKFSRKPFILASWQEHDIIRPVFETVRWSDEHEMYVRRYSIAWFEVARKQGKSEILAGVALYLLCADGEEGAEIYGCALDRDQARKVFDTAARMVKLSPVLSKVVTENKQEKKLIYFKTGSFYQAVASDAEGNLGHNPHGTVFDEVLTQKDSTLWDAMRTGMGTRVQPLMFAATTAGFTDTWAYEQHKFMVEVSNDPETSEHTFTYLRNTPEESDPWDEENWKLASPALGSFFSLENLRQEASDAKKDPTKETAFKVFRLNQWSGQTQVWIPMHEYKASQGRVYTDPARLRSDLSGRMAWAGFDAASKLDLCAWCMFVLPENEGEPVDVIWRFWIPERPLDALMKGTNGKIQQWIRDGWIRVAGSHMLDYEAVYEDIEEDANTFAILGIDFDEFGTIPVAQQLEKLTGISEDEMDIYKNTPARMSPGIDGVMGMVLEHQFATHGNPVAEWNFENAEIKASLANPDQYTLAKPERKTSHKRIDGAAASVMAYNAWWSRGNLEIPTSAYSDGHDLIIL